MVHFKNVLHLEGFMPGILESKSDKFHRLAERRASEIISKLRLLANLSDKRKYDYSEEHVKQLFDALESELKLCKARFKAADAATRDKFTFKKQKQ